MKEPLNVFWFRRDLRLADNSGLYHALKAGKPVLPIFIFDKRILNLLENKADRRVSFIHQTISELQQQLSEMGSALMVFYDDPIEVFKQIVLSHQIEAVFTNHDYEPYAKVRDAEVSKLLQSKSISFQTFKDQVIFEKDEVLKDDGRPYTVFTPYSRKWKAKMEPRHFAAYPSQDLTKNFIQISASPIPSLSEMGFQQTDFSFPPNLFSEHVIEKYNDTRDFPALKDGTSKLGIHLRFGTISIRALARKANELNQTFLNELIWRDFYQMILWHFPRVGEGRAFKVEYEQINWRNNEMEFDMWCKGMTGYPIVDAGMRELNATGFMHNRARMIVASFLTKHLLIDWRWGEAYFAQKLLDFDLASNNGGWQWAAGSGCDAAPYFRIFNPQLQTQKFDQNLTYIRKWVPELDEFTYPKPIVQHEVARKRALEVYGKSLGK